MSQTQNPQELHTKNKELLFAQDSRDKLLAGINLIADAVSATLGPRGRNVIIEQSKTVGLMQTHVGLMPRITKDGVSVAREINVDDKFMNLGVQIIKEVATRQNEQAGDGTTTATVLAQAIARDAINAIKEGENPVVLKKQIDAAVAEVIKYIETQAIEVKDTESLRSIATISANGDAEVGSIVANAVGEVGLDGIISVETAPITAMSLAVVEGLEFPAGFASPHFITNLDRGIADYKDAWVLMYDAKINDIKELVKIMEMAHKAEKPLMIICGDMTDEVLATLVYNKVKNGFETVVMKVPEYLPSRLDFLEDLAVVTGGKVITSEAGLSLGQVNEGHLGGVKRIRVNNELSEFIGGQADIVSLENRISLLKTKLDGMSKTDEGYDIVKGRLAKLSGGIAVIKVGGTSEIDIGERKDRIEDAINATKAAVEQGIVPGGGTMLLRASNYISANMVNQQRGHEIVIAAIQAPFYKILSNAGYETEEAVSQALKILEGVTTGLDVDTGGFVDLIEEGVIDPAKVVKNALKDAANVVSLLITTEVSIVNKGE